MKNWAKYLLLILFIILLVTPNLVFFQNFKSTSLSDNIEDWGNYGNFLNGTYMPIIALAGIIISLILGAISDKRNTTNLKIEQQKSRPILHIGYFDGEDKINIHMQNKGNGPLIIKKFYLQNLENSKIFESIYDVLPENIDIRFKTYTGNLKNFVLIEKEYKDLLLFEIDEYDYEENDNIFFEKFDNYKDIIRQEISKYKIIVEYNDVYDNKMPTYEINLKWFGRHYEL